MNSRILILSDLHCGHRAGITPTAYQMSASGNRRQWNKYAVLQAELWSWYVKTIKSLGKLRHVIVNGDAIDGEGSKSGGTELIVRDRIEQIEMAKEAVAVAKAEGYSFTYGTPYHTGCCEDMEDLLAKEFKAKIGSHEFITIAGKMFDVRHHCQSSSSPYGDVNQIGKQLLENEMWAARGEQPKADVVVRSHTHKYCDVATRIGDRVVRGVITPAMQSYGSKFGSRRCSRPVDVGITVVDIDKGDIVVRPLFASLKAMRAS